MGEDTVYRGRAEQTRVGLEQSITELRSIKASVGTLTALQLSNAVRTLATAALRLLRMQLDRHEEIE